MKRLLSLFAVLVLLPRLALAMPTDRVVLKVRDAQGLPVVGANVLTMEGAEGYLRQGIIWADSNGVAIAEVGRDAYLGLRVSAPGFAPFRLELAPGAPERRGKVIEVRLATRRKGPLIPVAY